MHPHGGCPDYLQLVRKIDAYSWPHYGDSGGFRRARITNNVRYFRISIFSLKPPLWNGGPRETKIEDVFHCQKCHFREESSTCSKSTFRVSHFGRLKWRLSCCKTTRTIPQLFKDLLAAEKCIRISASGQIPSTMVWCAISPSETQLLWPRISATGQIPQHTCIHV